MEKDIESQLFRLEKNFWLGDESFYKENLADTVTMVFSQPTGILDKKAIVESLSNQKRWTQVNFDDQQVIEINKDSRLVIYFATALREGNQYRTLASSLYIKEDGMWKLTFHQQTPI